MSCFRGFNPINVVNFTEKVPSKHMPNPNNVALPIVISVNCGQKSVAIPNKPKAPPTTLAW
ncbi:MAG TPA: hypothetical protein DE042_05205 [Colwellia sp.]|nr:hypothetical protein [Colwellia sp.]